MLSLSLAEFSKLSKTSSLQNSFDYDCVTLYKLFLKLEWERASWKVYQLFKDSKNP